MQVHLLGFSLVDKKSPNMFTPIYLLLIRRSSQFAGYVPPRLNEAGEAAAIATRHRAV